jgi:hypothetical protein
MVIPMFSVGFYKTNKYYTHTYTLCIAMPLEPRTGMVPGTHAVGLLLEFLFPALLARRCTCIVVATKLAYFAQALGGDCSEMGGWVSGFAL